MVKKIEIVDVGRENNEAISEVEEIKKILLFMKKVKK